MLYVIEPQVGEARVPEDGGSLLEGHGLDPARVLQLASTMRSQSRRVLLVGCEPEPLTGPEDFAAELSGAVRSAFDEAVPLILALSERLLRGDQVTAGKLDVNSPL